MHQLGKILAVGIVVAITTPATGHADSLGKSWTSGQGIVSDPHAHADLSRPTWDGVSASAALAAVSGLSGEQHAATRGAKETKLFKKVAPSVVMVVTNDGFGSGVLIDSEGRIVTNWHVVGGNAEVGVVFKPRDDGVEVSVADVVRAEVLHVDEVADLALLRVVQAPAWALSVETGGAADIEVGADVHAIGHPTGEGWTYTRGIISQFRKNYEWSNGDIVHRADVVQTQTPINPGNSGGPLVTDSGKLIGINSFKVPDAEGLNYAVSVTDVLRFLAAAAQPNAAQVTRKAELCQTTVLSETHSDEDKGFIQELDFDCDGAWDGIFFAPDDAKQAFELWLDENRDGNVDIVIYDDGRDGTWDDSLYDTNYDGEPDLRGIHSDGDIKPARYEPYTG